LRQRDGGVTVAAPALDSPGNRRTGERMAVSKSRRVGAGFWCREEGMGERPGGGEVAGLWVWGMAAAG
jgi:hypothetical protein